ncbi:polysaccharide deacetylase [haloarchaeon 3A1-DGR]|nr:polysaccharide deacetylase [haloarchaeon 3A1-DGR]
MPEATVCLNYGFDAVATWIHAFDSGDNPGRLSRGLYGVDVGLPRILDLHDRLDLPASFFIPGHTIESFPEAVGEIVDRGHEIQVHGWRHSTWYETPEEERADIERAIDAVYDVTGERPTGFRSPAAELSDTTLEILRDLDFRFDSSLQGHDFEQYYVHENWSAPRDSTFDRGEPTDIVEIPFDWNLTDFLAFTTIWSDPHRRGYGDEDVFFRRWYDTFDWMYQNKDNGLFMPITHPQIIGRIPRFVKYEEFLEYLVDTPDVAFEDMQTIAADFDG